MGILKLSIAVLGVPVVVVEAAVVAAAAAAGVKS
jgi:hypothetical protein